MQISTITFLQSGPPPFNASQSLSSVSSHVVLKTREFASYELPAARWRATPLWQRQAAAGGLEHWRLHGPVGRRRTPRPASTIRCSWHRSSCV